MATDTRDVGGTAAVGQAAVAITEDPAPGADDACTTTVAGWPERLSASAGSENRSGMQAAVPTSGGTGPLASVDGYHTVPVNSARRWISRSVTDRRELDTIYPPICTGSAASDGYWMRLTELSILAYCGSRTNTRCNGRDFVREM